jgi:hypothetical protein
MFVLLYALKWPGASKVVCWVAAAVGHFIRKLCGVRSSAILHTRPDWVTAPACTIG